MYSSTSVRTEQERSQEHSVMTILTDLKEEKRLDTTFVCFTEYDDTIQNKLVAFVKEASRIPLVSSLQLTDIKQARIAETEKYAHVTFFFNGGVEEPNKGEDRILVKSPKVATYDLKPEMSAYEVCDKLVERSNLTKYDVIVINFANPDMVGHTGVRKLLQSRLLRLLMSV